MGKKGADLPKQNSTTLVWGVNRELMSCGRAFARGNGSGFWLRPSADMLIWVGRS